MINKKLRGKFASTIKIQRSAPICNDLISIHILLMLSKNDFENRLKKII